MTSCPHRSDSCREAPCPFETDPYNPDHRVCLRCGREVWFRSRLLTGSGTFVSVAVCTIFIFALMDQVSRQDAYPPEQLPSSPPAVGVALPDSSAIAFQNLRSKLLEG